MALVAWTFILILVLIFCGVGIGFSFLGASILYTIASGGSILSFTSTIFSAHDSYALLAVPLFTLGGLLMEKSGIADRIIDWCEYALRKVKGGLGAVIPIASMLFGTLTGSALSTVNTIGNMMIEKMHKLGWDRRYTATLCCISAPLGFMIPPNMNAIIFSTVTTASVADLFLAGIVPGVLWGVGFIIFNRIVYKKYWHDPTEKLTLAAEAMPQKAENVLPTPEEKQSFGRLTVRAIPAFLMPIIILGGIYSGIFSPTEAGAVSALYAIIIGLFLFRKLSMKSTADCFVKTGLTLGIILLIIPFSKVFTNIMILKGIPNAVTSLLMGISNNKFVILLIVDILMVVAGCFLDANVLTLVIPPMLMPTMNMLGVSPIQFGCIVFVSIGIGSMTPPMAGSLYMAAKIAKVDVMDMMKPLVLSLIFVSIPILLLVTYVPWVSTWLPSLS